MWLMIFGGLWALYFSYAIGRRLGMSPILAPFSIVLWVVLGAWILNGGH